MKKDILKSEFKEKKRSLPDLVGEFIEIIGEIDEELKVEKEKKEKEA